MKDQPSRGLFRDSLISFVAGGGFALLTLVSGVILARSLGPAGRGLLATVLLWPAALACVAGLSLYDSALYYGAARPQARRALFANSVWSSLVLGGAAAAAACAILPRVVPLEPTQARLLIVNLIALPLWIWVDLGTALLQARRAFKWLAAVRLLGPAWCCAALLALLVGRRLTLTTAMLCTWSALALQAAAIAARLALDGDVSLRGDRRLFGDCWRYSARVHLGTLAGLGGRRLDQLAMSCVAAPAALGLYAFARTLTELLNQISGAITLALFPRLAEAADRHARAVTAARAARWTLLAQLAAAGAMAALARPFVHWIWGTPFLDALPIIYWLLPGAVLLGLRATLAVSVLGAGRPIWGTMAELASLIVVAIGQPLLAPRFGVLGAAAVVSAAAAVNCAVAALGFARTFGGASLRALVPGRADAVELRALIGRLAPWGERLLAAAVFATLFLTPLVYLPLDGAVARGETVRALADQLARPKAWCACAGTLAMLPLAWLWLRRTSAPEVPRALVLGVLAAAGWLAAAAACAPDLQASLAALRGPACMLGVALACASSARARRAAMAAAAASGVAIAAALLLETHSIHLPGLGAGLDALWLRPAAMLPHRNVAAACLIGAVPLLLARALDGPRAALAWIAPALGVVAAALVATSSRVSLCAALLGAGWLCWRRSACFGARALARLPIVLAAIALVLALRDVSFAGLPVAATEVPLGAKLERMITRTDASRVEREQLWRFGAAELARHPLVGVGELGFRSDWQAAHPWTPLPGVHNVWLQLGVSYGAPALALWLAGAGGLIWLALRARREELAIAAAMAAWLAASCFENLTDMMGPNLHAAAAAGALVAARWKKRG